MDHNLRRSLCHSLRRRSAVALLGLGLASAATFAEDADSAAPEPSRAADPAAFAQCLVDIGERAVAEGVSAEVVARVFERTQFQPRVIELDRRQPEFSSTFADYYGRRVTESRVSQGRELMRTHRALLEQIGRDTGVPPHYLLAFWGLETNFGSYFGKMAVPDSLATLACDERRSSFFTTELISALRIIDAGDITLDGMEGSWAGAMGHMQFMPSVFLRHAVDADGDGRRDLWGSIADALTSAGHFLADMGWERGLRWGREIRLPADFDYALAGRSNRRPLADWVALGVTDAAGRPLPPLDLPSAVLVPSGHEGPAFIVYDNFEIILGWNRSEYYAIGVGRLADRIAGAGGLSVDPPADGPRLSRDRVMALQTALVARGFDPGEPDGVFGPASRAALRAWQAAETQIPDGYPDAEVFAGLGVSLEAPAG
ncbi:MAG TPA: lytic murein transglycosylase [Pseudomonadales bacterium]|nr:lytic murein transglycosylase [Pseudomonadales bacterium]